MPMDIPAAGHAPIPLPLGIDEITGAWLTAALQVKAPGVAVENFGIVDINRGTCTKIRLSLQMDAAGKKAGIPETVILKGGFEAHSREMCMTHEKEVQAYRDILPQLELNTPICYFADYDAERRQGIVIIEDLVARGVTFCNPLKPQTYQEVARRLSALAAFHARSWDSPKLQPGGEWHGIEDLLLSLSHYMDYFLRSGKLEEYIASPRGAAISVRFQDREWIATALAQLPQLSPDTPQCLFHGDTHLGNLYVDPDGTPGFFDPQVLRGPSLSEVAYHITCALDTGDRKRWEGALVNHYLDELAQHGIEPLEFDQAMKLYSAYLVYGFCIFLVNDSHFQSEAINTAYTARFSAAMLENRTIEVLQAMA